MTGSKWCAVMLLVGLAAAVVTAQETTVRVSLADDESQSTGASSISATSADGRFVAFQSTAANLVTGDSNGVADVFVRDRVGATTERASVSSAETQGNDQSVDPALSADGLYVAFESIATNLVAGDSNGWQDVFVRDRTAGTTEVVSVSSGGTVGNDDSWDAAISADGRFVAFTSNASNLVAGDDGLAGDIFVRDRTAGTTERVSLDTGGGNPNSDSSAAAISADGRWVAFASSATDLVAGDTNSAADIFVRDRQAGTTTLVSLDSGGGPANGDSGAPSISADGRFVAFQSLASDLVAGDTNTYQDIFVRDLVLGTTERVSVDSSGTEANGVSTAASLSGDGRFAAFHSGASNLVASDTNAAVDVFVRDRQTRTTDRVSLTAGGAQAAAQSLFAAISADGRSVVFESDATNLVAGDTNLRRDIFLRGPRNPGARLDLVAGQWHQIGLPLVPGAAPADTVASLFGDDLTGVYGTDWRVYDWDEANQQYLDNTYLPSATALAQGEGYWVKKLASEPGTFVDMTGALQVSSFFDVFLEVGWNMVGHPYEFTVDWADVKVVYDAAEHTLADAEAAGKMVRTMYRWNGAAYSSFNGLTPGAMGTLSAWDGFWVEALASGVTLRIYGTPTGGDRASAQPPRGWFVRLVAASGAWVDDGNVLGMVEGATVGLDANDLPEMGPFADDYLTVVFPHPEWRSGAGDYTTDFRPLAVRRGQRELRWAFEVRSGVERPVTLRWEGPAQVLARSEVVDPLSGVRYRASDHPGGISFDLKEPRRLEWVVRLPGPASGAAGE